MELRRAGAAGELDAVADRLSVAAKPTNVIHLVGHLVGRVDRAERYWSGPGHRLQRLLDVHNGMAERLRLREKRHGLSAESRAALDRCHARAAEIEDAIRCVNRLAQGEVAALRDDVGAVVQATRVASIIAASAIAADAAGRAGGAP